MTFSLFKKNKNEIYSPVTGKYICLDTVSDIVFARKMMGDGVAFSNIDEVVSSPCNGKIIMVANTKHAIGIQMKNGFEILIHVGLNTVDLHGAGFANFRSVGDKVRVGDPLIRVDLDFMNKKEVDLTVPMIFTNSNDYAIKWSDKDIERKITSGDIIASVQKG